MISSPSTFYAGQFITGSYPDNPDTGSFVSIWNTTKTSAGSSTAAQITLPLESTGTYSFTVDWGDGSTNVITVWNQAERTHTYTTPGVYKIKITGTCYGWRFNNTGDRLKFISVQQWGTGFRLGNSSANFHGCSNLLLDYVRDVLDLTGTTTFANLFNSCTSLRGVGRINEWNTVNVTTMASAFVEARNFDDNIGGWNTSNVTNMSFMFFITSFAGRFNNRGSSAIGNWNTSNVTNMSYMFYNQQTFNQPIGTKVATVSGSTYTAWDVKNVTDFTFFLNCTTAIGGNGRFNQDISNWNTSKVTSLYVAFSNQPLFNQDLSTKVVTVNGVTYTAWDTLNVTDMAFAFIVGGSFAAGNFNGNISNWNTSKVTNFSSFLSNQKNFNQDVSTKTVTVNGATYTAWNTSAATNMSFMFWVRNTESGIFNQNISNWDVSKVATLSNMFRNQTSFNQPLNSWNTVLVTNMTDTFYNATAFDQSISDWKVNIVTTFGTDGFMGNKTNLNYSSANYDALLIGWASRPVLANKTINFGTIKYTSAASAARAVLTSSPNNWTIIDGGLV